MAQRGKSTEDRFIEKVLKQADGCWGFQSSKARGGYSRFHLQGRTRRAHIVSYELFKGPAGGKFVCHTCDNPPCVNPEHLFLGTPAQNSSDMKAKARQARGPTSGRSKLTESAVHQIRASTLTQQALADQFGVSQVAISKVQLRCNWKHI